MIHLNCDLGEYPNEIKRDKMLLTLVDAVNIACGGHAGDKNSARYWQSLAEDHNKAFHLHLSFPDRQNFGRTPMTLSPECLASALDSQREALPHCKAVKFHGALYTMSAVDQDLAKQLLNWCHNNSIDTVLAPPNSAMETMAADYSITNDSIKVIKEGFADRRYQLHKGQLRLTPRAEKDALFSDPRDAIAQIKSVLDNKKIPTGSGDHDFSCDTWCIHSDSEGAIPLASAIRQHWRSNHR